SPASPDSTSEQLTSSPSHGWRLDANLCQGDRLLELESGAAHRAAAKHTERPMRLHAMDAWVRAASVLTDEDELRAVLHAAALAGGAAVVGEEFYAFQNGAVTGVLLLAQSHLSIHTW